DLDARKNPLIAPDAVAPRTALLVLLATAVVLAALGPWPVWLAVALSLFFFSVYSAAPRIKAVPILGSLANIGMFAPLLFLGLGDALVPHGLSGLVLACAALVLETQLVHEAADQHEDRGGGVRTTWLTVGPRHTALIAALCGVVAAAGAASLGGAAALGLAVAAAAGFAVAVPVALTRPDTDAARAARLRLAMRWSGLAFGAGLLAAWRWGG
ncbi:MAG TPA: UbiA family prenyltransferase, partial [Candidatus Dormibacteraeota bacterium]|nr:UbiA family prenyltransferase [Candidatus Dormibacteraeota bacterium]